MPTVHFQPDDALYLSCIGESTTFDKAWSIYCFVDRICFYNQCDDPAFAAYRQGMVLAVQRAISAGLVNVDDDFISLSPDLRRRFDTLQKSGVNEFQAAEEIDAFLQSQTWDVVSDAKLPS